MSKIVALRGYDGVGSAGCGCSGMGVDASSTAPAIATDPKMSTSTMLIWAASIGTIGYIFWATLQPPKRRRAA